MFRVNLLIFAIFVIHLTVLSHCAVELSERKLIAASVVRTETYLYLHIAAIFGSHAVLPFFLSFVQIFRHGDRTPVEPYPTDPYKDKAFWPVGFGQLTNVSMSARIITLIFIITYQMVRI